jgi:serine/threonine-protein kinase RsbW
MKKHTLNIKSDIHELPEIERFIENVCDYYNLNNNYFGNIMVAVNEAVENAIIHGNENNANKTVSLQFELVPSGILFTIEDEGT